MTFSIPELNDKNKLKLIFYDSANLINEKHWEAINNNQNIYLSLNYLKALESALKHDIPFRYIQFYNDKDEPVAIAIAQMVRFVDKGSKYSEQLCILSSHLKTKILNSLDIKVLVCGNVFACGENGFMYNDKISHEEAYDNLNIALYRLRKSEKINGQTSMVLLKEFWPSNFQYSDHIKQNKYREFMIDVNMILKIHPSWKTIDDYLNSMTAKFRTKAKGVFKKSAQITIKEFDLIDVLKYKDRIEELYLLVLEKSDFSVGALNGEAFYNLKKNLTDKFIIKGYFFKDELVGFSSAFISNGNIDANYIGIDYNYNYDYAVYQKMLYDFVALAINKNVTELRLGRTAEEIKSCLGAEPTNMKLYIKLRNTVSNKLIKPIIESISPSEFELRKPFKADFS
ncbi:hypothetical protein FRY74_04485 [Vicingus serpentipes]|uniref:GNAT family N-acetyltransferase n=1 Tax=Vicingus serpentipes TaxID=1926625 RepID=A0A5C6RW71_9FLAO|nr:hypothetical protein [Vicingus serpentipes]TXB65830.1 hypothetical protein FRY74_04485 [Vicingus serpentipes]